MQMLTISIRFYSSAEIFESVGSCTEFVYDKTRINRHAIARASWFLCFHRLDVQMCTFKNKPLCLKITSKGKNKILAWILKVNVLLNFGLYRN